MSDALSPSTWNALRSSRGIYSLVLGTTLGSTIWHGLIGGPIAYRVLGRLKFGELQSSLFPKFFALQSTASLALLGLYHRAGKLSRATLRSDRQAWMLVTMALTGLLNWAVVGPWTTAVMRRRWRKEKIEGKEYNDPSASADMKTLNKKFAKLHAASSLLNLAFMVSIIGHTAYVGTYGAL
ncbi:hypothetical protein JCM10207_000554 [Rhodosporidiobolus poonsookiae]